MVGSWQASLLLASEPTDSPNICISTAVAYLCLLREQGCSLAISRHQIIYIAEVST